jgi:hypothetical protein
MDKGTRKQTGRWLTSPNFICRCWRPNDRRSFPGYCQGEIGTVVLGRAITMCLERILPYRETSNIYDGSRFTADGDTKRDGRQFRGATGFYP